VKFTKRVKISSFVSLSECIQWRSNTWWASSNGFLVQLSGWLLRSRSEAVACSSTWSVGRSESTVLSLAHATQQLSYKVMTEEPTCFHWFQQSHKVQGPGHKHVPRPSLGQA